MKRSMAFIPCHPQARPAQLIALGFSTQILIHSKLRIPTFLRRLLAVHQSQHLIGRDKGYGIEESRGCLPHKSTQHCHGFQKMHLFSLQKNSSKCQNLSFPSHFFPTYLLPLHWGVFNRISVISLISVPRQVSSSFMIYEHTITMPTAYVKLLQSNVSCLPFF